MGKRMHGSKYQGDVESYSGDNDIISTFHINASQWCVAKMFEPFNPSVFLSTDVQREGFRSNWKTPDGPRNV